MSLLEVSFKDLAWLHAYGLTPHNALEYFSLSQFYDRTCNNEVVKMQTKFNNFEEMNMRMGLLTGIEYSLIHHQMPLLFVVQSHYRKSPEQVTPLAFYYILDGTIFQAPDLRSVLASRMTMCASFLNNACTLAQDHSVFDPLNGYFWKSDSVDGFQADSDSPVSDAELFHQSRKLDRILHHLAKSNTSFVSE